MDRRVVRLTKEWQEACEQDITQGGGTLEWDDKGESQCGNLRRKRDNSWSNLTLKCVFLDAKSTFNSTVKYISLFLYLCRLKCFECLHRYRGWVVSKTWSNWAKDEFGIVEISWKDKTASKECLPCIWRIPQASGHYKETLRHRLEWQMFLRLELIEEKCLFSICNCLAPI